MSVGTEEVKNSNIPRRLFPQFSIQFLLTVILVLSGFLAGWCSDLRLAIQRLKPEPRIARQSAQELDSETEELRLKVAEKIREKLDTEILLRGCVGISAKVENRGNNTLLAMPLGSADGLSVGDLGVVLKNKEITKVIAITQLRDDSCLSQVIEKVGDDRPVSFGDRVEFIVMDDFSIRALIRSVKYPPDGVPKY